MLAALGFSGLGSVWVFSDLDFVGFSVTWIFVWFFQWFGSWLVFLDVGCTRFFRLWIFVGFFRDVWILVFRIWDFAWFFGFGFFSFADTNIYKNNAEMKLFRLRCGFARRKKRLPDERNFKA